MVFRDFLENILMLESHRGGWFACWWLSAIGCGMLSSHVQRDDKELEVMYPGGEDQTCPVSVYRFFSLSHVMLGG